MPRRSIWSARQRAELFDLPTDEAALLRHYTLSDDDIEHIRVRRRGHNRLGFALQLGAFRYPGRLLVVGETIPLNVLHFIAAQLGMRAADLDGYAVREETRREHLAEIRRIYGYRMFMGRCARDLKVWLENEAEAARSNEGLARRFVEECRRRQVILPGLSVLERLCAGALVAAERRIETGITAGLDDAMRMRLDRLLDEEVDGGVSRFVWLRRFEVGRNSADINGLLDRLEFLQGFDLPSDLLETVPPHRIARLRRQGERYFTDGLRDISGDRRLAILAVCAVEWRVTIADAVVETVERTLFIVDWLLDADMQRRANTGLNQGEAHHALKNALRIGSQGEIRDRSSEGQHYRMAGLNLLAAIVIYWNTAQLGEAVRQRKHAGLTVEPELLAHISPLGWAHILLTGEYRWPKRR